jgi:uncharacterized Tic20 family protein
MRNGIPLNLRLLAVTLHLIGGSIVTSMIIGVTMIFFDSITSISFLSPPLILILWVQTRDIHPFVNQAGRDAINCSLNTLLGMLLSVIFTIFVFSVTCGVGNPDPSPFFLSLIPLALVAIAYFFNSIVAAIFAIQGHRLNSRLIYPFVKPL